MRLYCAIVLLAVMFGPACKEDAGDDNHEKDDRWHLIVQSPVQSGYVIKGCALVVPEPTLLDGNSLVPDGFVLDVILIAVEDDDRNNHSVLIGSVDGAPVFLDGKTKRPLVDTSDFTDCSEKAAKLKPDVRERLRGFAGIH